MKIANAISYENAPGIFMCLACYETHYYCFHAKQDVSPGINNCRSLVA